MKLKWNYKKNILPESDKEVVMYSAKNDEIFLGYENSYGIFTKSKKGTRTYSHWIELEDVIQELEKP